MVGRLVVLGAGSFWVGFVALNDVDWSRTLTFFIVFDNSHFKNLQQQAQCLALQLFVLICSRLTTNEATEEIL